MLGFAIEVQFDGTVPELRTIAPTQADPLGKARSILLPIDCPVDIYSAPATYEKGIQFGSPLGIPISSLEEDYHVRLVEFFLGGPFPGRSHFEIVGRGHQFGPGFLPGRVIVLAGAVV